MHNELDYRFGVRDIYFLGRRHLHLNCEENIYSAIYYLPNNGKINMTNNNDI